MSSEPFVRAGAASAPAFSCDGRHLFHLRGSSLPQAWALDLSSGEHRQLTSHDEKLSLLRRAPKDDRLVFGMDRGGDERQELWLLDPASADGGHPLAAQPGIIHEFGAWSPDGTSVALSSNARDEAHLDPILLDLATGQQRRLMNGVHETRVLAWHPDGGRLLVAVDRATCDVRLLVVDAATGASREIPRPRASRFAAARWTPDGTLMALTDAWQDTAAADGSLADRMALCRIDPESGAAHPVWAPSGAEVEAWSLSPGGGRLLATVENDRGYALLRVGPADGAGTRPVVDGLPRGGVVSDLAWSPDGAALAFCASDPVTPPGLWIWEAASGGARPVWQPEGEGAARFELVEWESFDGRRIPGWMARPAGSPLSVDGFPAVVWVHGGPASQARANFRPDMQALLAQGYAVLMPNVRGSTGYGRAWMEADDVELRLDSVEDLAAGARWLAQQPGIDPHRIAVMGQSYGGYMVLAAVTEHPDLWRCAIDFYGIGDFGTLLAATGPWRRAHRAVEYGDPVRHRALFDRISPLRHIDRFHVPLLVLHGKRDPRVAIAESDQVVAALREGGKPVEYEVFDYAGHGFTREGDRLRAYGAVADFLRRHL